MPTLDFRGKQYVYAHHLTVPHRPLVPDPERSIDYKGTDDSLIIHGDNLHALKALMPRYAGRIKCIYIDPPYNTGSENWAYNDNVNSPPMRKWLKENTPVDREDLERHDKWLCMMWPRLHLLKELLSDDGAIFISIDDNEQANLKIICDEIFGQNNFVSCLHTEMSTTQGMKVAAALKGKIVKNAEFVLVYAKNRESVIFKPLYEKREWDSHYSIFYDSDTDEQDSVLNFLKKNREKANLGADLKASDIGENYANNAQFREFIHSNAENIWQDTMCDIKIDLSGRQEEDLNTGKIVRYCSGERIYFLKKTSTGIIRQLLPLCIAIGETDDFGKTYGLRKIRGDWWKAYYKDMMNINKEGEMIFKNGKKPIRLIRDIVKASTGSKDIVLDSFAGSGSTAHAVLALNKEDGGDRKFILVECEDYADTKTAERVRHVIRKEGGGALLTALLGHQLSWKEC